MIHRCHAKGCETEVAPRLLMCFSHWKLVPLPLRQAVWKNYRPGQEIDKNPSTGYLVAAKKAIDAVAAAEGRQLTLVEVKRHGRVE